MIGSFLTRGLVLVLGYAYPAYECYKTVEKNKPEIEHLLFWCQYWILVAVLTVCERVGDAFVSWVPMYSEAKLAFFVYLWYPKTRGTTYVYDSFFRPYVSKHENEIDRNLYELRTLAGDMIILYWQRAASYGQTRVFEILHYVMAQPAPAPAAQSKQTPASPTQSKQVPALAPLAPQSKQAPAPRSVQNSPKQDAKARQPTQAGGRQPAARKKLAEVEEPPSPAYSTSSSQHQKEVAREVGTSEISKPAAPATESKTETANVAPDKGSELKEAEIETLQMEPVAPKGLLKTNSVPNETVMEETIRLTRGRLRKARSAGVR